MKQKIIFGILVGAASSALLLFINSVGWLSSLEDNTWNRRARFFAGQSAPAKQIKLILLDQETLDWAESESGLSWPWYRQAYLPILDFCERAGVKGVAFDVLYTENSAYSVEDDEALGAGIRAGAPFTLALFLSRSESKGAAKTWPDGWQAPSWPLGFDSSEAEARWASAVQRPSAYSPSD